MANDLVALNGGASALTLADTMTLGEVFAKSGFFEDSKAQAQAVVKILYGQELGFSPVVAMLGIHIIKGKPSLSAGAMAAKIKGSRRYNYRVLEHTDKACRIEFFELQGDGFESIGESSYTHEEAVRAGTQNLAKYAKNMLFARAMSNGAKWYCPDLFGGPIYTPDELGATIDGDTGEVVSMPADTKRPAKVDTRTGEVLDASTEPDLATLTEKPHDCTEARWKALQVKLLCATEGFTATIDDREAFCANLSSLLGWTVHVTALKDMAGDEFLSARREQEGRNLGRRTFFALCTEHGYGDLTDEQSREFCGKILGREVVTRSKITAAEWGVINAALPDYEHSGVVVPADQEDPFADTPAVPHEPVKPKRGKPAGEIVDRNAGTLIEPEPDERAASEERTMAAMAR